MSPSIATFKAAEGQFPEATKLLLDSGDGLRLFERRYAAGLVMGRHVHDEWRFCLAIRGAYTDSWFDGHRRRRPGDLSLHPVQESHDSVFHAACACFHIEFGGVWRSRIVSDVGIRPEPHEFVSGRAPQIALQLREESAGCDLAARLVIEGLAYELIGWSARALRPERGGASWVFRARTLLRDRFAEHLTLDEVADAVAVHPVHLARQFRTTFGCSVGEYVRRCRIAYACSALRDSTPLSEIATSAGFADQSHFTRVFKRETGLTPRQFRLLR